MKAYSEITCMHLAPLNPSSTSSPPHPRASSQKVRTVKQRTKLKKIVLQTPGSPSCPSQDTCRQTALGNWTAYTLKVLRNQDSVKP